MSDAQIAWIIGGVLIAVICIAIPLIIRDIRKNKNGQESDEVGEEAVVLTSTEGMSAMLHAVVVDMACDVGSIGYQGYKQPRTVTLFKVLFKTDEGEILEVKVSEDMYTAFEVGLSGTLTLSAGNIDSFEPNDGAYEEEIDAEQTEG